MEERMQGLIDFIRTRHAPFLAASDWIAAHPELGHQEHEASRLWEGILREHGFTVTSSYGGYATAFCAEAGSAPSPRVVFLAEYDALPEIGHGCGHNWSGAASALAGAALASLFPELPGSVRVVGTPAEETDGAKIGMAEAGLFDGVDLAMMIHAESGRTQVVCKCLAMEGVEFRFQGKPAHAAASPWEGKNALNGVQLFFHALDMLRQHVRPEIRMHGIVVSGGAAPNIVPEVAEARFYFRAPRRKELDALLEQVWNCARGAALATGTTVTWRTYEKAMDDMVRNPAAERLMTEIIEGLGYPCSLPEEASGSSDVGNVSYRCPTLHPEMATVPEQLIIHSREFARAMTSPAAHASLLDAAQALATCGYRVLTDATLRERIRADFRTYRDKESEGR